MTLFNGSNVQTMQGKDGVKSYGTFRSGLSLGGFQGKLFADLLAQAASLQSQSSNSGQASTVQTSNETATSVNTDASQDVGGDDDRAALRVLMQRIRDDAKTLYHNRQRIKHTERKHGDDSARQTDDASTAQSTETDDVDASKGSEETTAENAGNQTDAETFDVDATVAEAENTIVAVASGDANIQTEQTLSAVTNDETDDTDTTDTKSILQDMIQAEQALLLLLNKMIYEKVAEVKKGGVTFESSAVTDAGETTGTNMIVPVLTLPMENSSTTDISETKTSSQENAPFWLSQIGVDFGAAREILSSSHGFSQGIGVQTANKDAGQTSTNVDTLTQNKGNTELWNLFSVNAQGSAGLSTMSGREFGFLATEAISEIGSMSDVVASGGISTMNTGTQPVVPEGVKSAGSYDFASQLSSARITKGPSTGLPSAVEQVVLQLHKQVKAGNNEMTVQLRPAELGRIDVKLFFSTDNKVHGTVVADSQATLDLLSKNVESLQRALQDAGLRADSGSLQFNLRGDGNSSSFSANGNSQGNSGSNGHFSSFASSTTEDTTNTDDSGVDVYYLTPGRINFRV